MRVVHRLRYKQDGASWVEDRLRQIWVLEPDTGMWRPITSNERDDVQPRWSWDGRRLAWLGPDRSRERVMQLVRRALAIRDQVIGELTIANRIPIPA